MHEGHKAELRKEKKIKRLFKKSAWSFGIGLGLLLLKVVIVPYIGDNEEAEHALVTFALCLIGYGATLVGSFVFLKKHMLKIDLLMTWIVLPLILGKLLFDLT